MSDGGERRPAVPVRFGPFEADAAAGELRKNGTRIKLQDQPFRILLILLERPGEVVTREELVEKLWPDGTFVEFEHSLNTAVNKLRRALNDSPARPHYIETVPRRGYRFIGMFEGFAPPRRGRVALKVLAGALLLVLALAAVYLAARATPRASEAPRPALTSPVARPSAVPCAPTPARASSLLVSSSPPRSACFIPLACQKPFMMPPEEWLWRPAADGRSRARRRARASSADSSRPRKPAAPPG